MKTFTEFKDLLRGSLLKMILIVAMLLALAISAQAQQYAPLTLPGLTNNIAANTTNTYEVNSMIGASNVFTVTKCDEFALEFNFTHLGTNVANVTWSFADSGDGVLFDSTLAPPYTFTIPTAGTNNVSLTTNIYVGAAGYFGLASWANTSSNAVTNIVITNIVGSVTNITPIPIVRIFKKPLRRN